jgi:ribonuclease R
VKLLGHLAKKIGSQLDAVITGVEEFGLFAQGIELPAEGLVHVDTLGDDFYRFDRDSHSLAGYRSGNRFRLGDVIRVEVAHVDIDKRELDFRIVKRLGSPHRERPEARGGKKQSRKQAASPRPEREPRAKGRRAKTGNAPRKKGRRK